MLVSCGLTAVFGVFSALATNFLVGGAFVHECHQACEGSFPKQANLLRARAALLVPWGRACACHTLQGLC